jgi:hypothetical protein
MGSILKEAPHVIVASLMLKTKDTRGRTCKRLFNKTEEEMDADVSMKIIKMNHPMAFPENVA